jgi:hypothetical protein
MELPQRKHTMDCPTRREGIQRFELLLTYAWEYVKKPLRSYGEKEVFRSLMLLALSDFVDNLIDKSVFLSNISFHKVIAVSILLDNFQRLAGAFG